MEERIRRHRERRGGSWCTIEEPLELVGALTQHTSAETVVLVDCLTFWLSNILLSDMDTELEIGRLVETLPVLPGSVVLVSNEVGLGIVPENALARRFRDDAGRLNQAVAGVADTVVFVAAGLPLHLKGAPQ